MARRRRRKRGLSPELRKALEDAGFFDVTTTLVKAGKVAERGNRRRKNAAAYRAKLAQVDVPTITAAGAEPTTRKARLERARRYAREHDLPEPRLTRSGVDFGKPKIPRYRDVEHGLLFSGLNRLGLPGYGIESYGGLAAEQLAQAAIQSPAGLYELGKNPTLDEIEALSKGPGSREFWLPEFRRTRKMLKEMGVGFWETTTNPKDYPGYFFLNALGIASMGAGLAARGMTAGQLAAAGERGAAAKALIRRPPPGPRRITLKTGEDSYFTEEALASRSALTEATQRVKDKVLMRWANEGSGALQSFARGRLERQLGRESAANIRVKQAIDVAGAHRLMQRHLTTPQQLALRLYAENTTPASVIAFHTRELAGLTGRVRARARGAHKARMLLVRQAEKYLTVDGAGNVQFAKHKRRGKLEAMYAQMEKLADDRTEIMAGLDVLTPETAWARIQGPGQIIRGGRYVEPTAARQGIPSASLEAKRRRVARLEERYDRALDRELARSSQSYVLVDDAGREFPLDNPYAPPTLKPNERTPAQAQKRLAELEKGWRALVVKRAEQLMPPEERAAEALRRAAHNRRIRKQRQAGESGKRRLVDPNTGRPLSKQESAKYEAEGAWEYMPEDIAPIEEAGLIKPELEQMATKGLLGFAYRSDTPEALKLRAMLDEMLALEAGLERAKQAAMSEAERAIFAEEVGVPVNELGEPIEPSLGTTGAVTKRVVPTDMPPDVVRRGHGVSSIFSPPVKRLGAALSVARDELASAEAAAARRIEPVGIVGGEGPEGRMRVPYAAGPFQRQRLPTAGTAGYVGLGPAEPGTFRHAFKGAILKGGGGRLATTRLVAEDYLEAYQYKAAIELVDRYRSAAHFGERIGDEIPIRIRPAKAGAIGSNVKMLMGKVEDGIALSRAEKNDMRRAFRDFEEYLFPKAGAVEPYLVEGGDLGWISPHLLAGRNKPMHVPGKLLSAWDTLNNYAKLRLIYLKVGYIPPNLLGNVALNIIQQGFLAIPNLQRATRTNRYLGEAYTPIIDSGMGRGITTALTQAGEGGPLQRLTQGVATLVSTPTDLFTRRASFYYEARRAGFRGAEATRRLLTDPELEAKRIEVFRRAREAAIEYERLGPTEKNILRRIVFIYPWVKGSTMYLGKSVRDQPALMAAVMQLGLYGQEHNPLAGDIIPEYQQGIFKVGGSDMFPVFLDPRGAAIYQTPAEVKQAITGNPRKTLEFAQPILQQLLGVATETDPRGGWKIQDPGNWIEMLSEAGREFEANTPQAQLIQALRGKADETSSVSRSRNQALLRAGLGGLGPSTLDLEQASEVAERNKRKKMSPNERVLYDQTNWLESALEAARTYDLLPGSKHLPKKLRTAVRHRTGRWSAYAGAGLKRGKPDSFTYQQRAFALDVKTLERRGAITKAEARKANNWAKTATKKDLEDERERLTDKYFGGEAIRDARQKITRAAFKADVERIYEMGAISQEVAENAMRWANEASMARLESERERVFRKYFPDEVYREAIKELR